MTEERWTDGEENEEITKNYKELKMKNQEKKYIGYGYHGGGRKPLPEDQKKKYITISVSGQPEEIERLKAKAQEEHKTVSRFILDDVK